MFKLLLLVLSLTVLELSAVFIVELGVVSLLYPDLVSEFGWTLGFVVAVFFALFLFGLGARQRFMRARDESQESPLAQAVPAALVHECLIFKQNHTVAAIGFVALAPGWAASANTLLSTVIHFHRQAERLAVAEASPITGRSHTYVMIRVAAESQGGAIRRITTMGQALAQSLSRRGIAAEWVHDSLGVEQLYWMCILGKEFHEDVTLDCSEGTLHAKVGGGSPRALTAASFPPESVETRKSLLNHRADSPPHALIFQLSPLDSDVIRKQLARRAVQPETLALVDALGPDFAPEVLTGRLNADECATIASLSRGYREGIWQCACHLICAPEDLEAFAAELTCNPVAIEPHRFGAVATIAPSTDMPMALLPTNSLVHLLRGPKPPVPRSVDERQGAKPVAKHGSGGGVA